MNRACKGAATALVALTLSVSGAAAANAAPASVKATKPNAADIAFLKSNEQVNLAEISLAKIELKRSHTEHGRELAHVTMRDHLAAQKKVKAVAKADGVTLPTTPNAAQLKLAAQLKTAPRVNYRYFVDQVAGHKTSIAQTKSELKSGSKSNVLHYARYYLPVAQMHLTMSKNDLARWHRYH